MSGFTCATETPTAMSCLSDEMWLFSTSTRGWKRVDTTAVNESRPSARVDHTMTSVGLDLWVYGGTTYVFNTLYGSTTGEGDTCTTRAALLLLHCCCDEAKLDPLLSLRQQQLLLLRSCVCCCAYTALDVCVPDTGYSDELWRFSTSTRVWERVDTTVANQAHPSERTGHTMTSVGLDLWVFGGQISNSATSYLSSELWRFTTLTRTWELVDTTVNDVGTRIGHTMTSVGLDLYIHGGYVTTPTRSGEGEACSTRAALLLLLRLDRECTLFSCRHSNCCC
jgi:hypothetical protein